MPTMNEVVTAQFTLEALNAELKLHGIKGEAKSHSVAIAALVKVRQMSNLDSWTALALDLTGGKISRTDLQALLDSVGAKSPAAAGNRVVMQRFPEKYGVSDKDRARPGNVPASTRSGRVTVQAVSLDEAQSAELAKLLK